MKVGARSLGPSSLMVRICMALPNRMRLRTRELTKIHTKAEMQGQGCASDLVRMVCKEADEAGIVLILFPQPYGDDIALSRGQLIKWYSGFGFQQTQQEPPMMARMPGRIVQELTPAATAVALYG